MNNCVIEYYIILIIIIILLSILKTFVTNNSDYFKNTLFDVFISSLAKNNFKWKPNIFYIVNGLKKLINLEKLK